MSWFNSFFDKFASFNATSIIGLLGIFLGIVYYLVIHGNKMKIKAIKLLRQEDRPKAVQMFIQDSGYPFEGNLTPEQQYHLFLKIVSDKSVVQRKTNRWVAIILMLALLAHVITSIVEAGKSILLAHPNPKSDTIVNYNYPREKDTNTSPKIKTKQPSPEKKAIQDNPNKKIALFKTLTVLSTDGIPVSNVLVECSTCIEKSVTTDNQGKFTLRREFDKDEVTVSNIMLIKGSRSIKTIIGWTDSKTTITF